ncbi:MAG: succinylglutamate desuccinylase/aspartoacylase family protein [Candidatus Aenigmarchaeota archaeon]|nr:succinylglutamate desuccinylase/aspartoacylase family protein [Candidatus Aenigmarchaeota archaeon]
MLLIYCLHGDEIITEKIAKQLNKKYGINILLGNPEARNKQIRFSESDLNRSFNKRGTQESQRAKELKQILSKRNEDIIIDLHTTTAKMPPIGIITNLKQLKLASRLGVENLILMNDRFSTGGSLIENIPNSISLEIYPDKKSIKDAKRMILNSRNPEMKLKSFNIYEIISSVKIESVEKDITNLQELNDGHYPVFYGEKAYKDIAYLKARKKVITLQINQKKKKIIYLSGIKNKNNQIKLYLI